jgi:arginine repressor
MPKRKVTTPQLVPQSAQIIQFSDLKRKREIANADMTLTIHVALGKAEAGDAVLLRCGDQYALGVCTEILEADKVFMISSKDSETKWLMSGKVVAVEA